MFQFKRLQEKNYFLNGLLGGCTVSPQERTWSVLMCEVPRKSCIVRQVIRIVRFSNRTWMTGLYITLHCHTCSSVTTDLFGKCLDHLIRSQKGLRTWVPHLQLYFKGVSVSPRGTLYVWSIPILSRLWLVQYSTTIVTAFVAVKLCTVPSGSKRF